MKPPPVWHPSIPVVAAIHWRAPAIKPPALHPNSYQADVDKAVDRAIALEATQLFPKSHASKSPRQSSHGSIG